MKLCQSHQLLLLLTLSVSCSHFASEANQIDSLDKFLNSRRSLNLPRGSPLAVGSDGSDHDGVSSYSPVCVGSQEGLKEADRIAVLPGQPGLADFDQYGGYVTVDPQAGRALFYYFAESPQNSSSKPLVLWLNGGPGCSSFGYGAMEELGPFRVHNDGETLYPNPYAWNKVANVLFLDSPAGVGFSYSNDTKDYNVGDKRTAEDSYAFLVNWLERFPEYKTRDFYITGESYAGHYVPQLAYTILSKNKVTNQTVINLKGIAIGNAWIDDQTNSKGMYDYFWTHALISDESIAGIHKYCDFVNFTTDCNRYLAQAVDEIGEIDIYNIYAPLCTSSLARPRSTDSVYYFDPCTDNYVYNYLNLKEVQEALHAKPTRWDFCRVFDWTDAPTTILPIIEQLIASGINVSLYSGDTDGRVPVTSTRYSIDTLNLSVATPWRPWYSSKQVGGYVVEYKGLTLTTVRGAGHTVPSYQPERALTMISSFLKGELPPPS